MKTKILFGIAFLMVSTAWASGTVPQSFTYEGNILNSAGTAPLEQFYLAMELTEHRELIQKVAQKMRQLVIA
jgi:hypothetical protein